MAEENSEPPRKLVRRPKFSDEEVLALVEEVRKRRGVVLGRHDYKTGVTAQKKQQAWQQICFAVNAVSRVLRSVEEVRRKFVDMKTHVKSKASAEVQHFEGTG